MRFVTISRIQRGKDEKRDRSEQEERREETRRTDKEEVKANRRKDKEEAEERNKIVQKEVYDRIDEANKRAIEQQQSTNLLLSKMVDIQSDTIARAVNTERRIEEKEERETRYREEERNHQKDREIFTQLMSTMIQAQNNLNQTIPQSIHSSRKSVLNISTSIVDESTRQMTVSPVSNINVPHRNHDRLIIDTTVEKRVAQKRQRKK